MAEFRAYAMNENGDITICTCPPELRGTGRCNHVNHQEPGESVEDFIKRMDFKKTKEKSIDISVNKEISQEEINLYAKKLDEIAGKRVDASNFFQVLKECTPDQIAELTSIGFNSASEFSLPITDERYEDENIKNKLYFANLPAYGIAGNKDAIIQMFDKVGDTPTLDGMETIEHSYSEGLTPHEYFLRQFSARDASINKSVGTAKPGYCIFENSLVQIKDDLNENSLTTIKWKDLSVGDEFVDGSKVVEIQEWQYKKCYELKIKNCTPIVLSHDHLLFGDIILNNNIITNLEKSRAARENIGESDTKWICVEDIYNFFTSKAKIHLNDDYELEYVKVYDSGNPQKVRCISTNTGFYETNGLIHHNTARKLFYAMSDTQVAKECGGPYIDALHCKMPEGHVCEKCAHLSKGGETIKEGQLIGGLISTNMSEALTQLSMKQKHVGSTEVSGQLNVSNTIMATLDGWSTSSIIQKASKAKTTEEKRKVLFEGLKEQYASANIKQDDFNIMMVAKKLTSFKRTKDGLRPVQDNETCDIVSMATIGNYGNIFKTSELSTGYKYLTKPNVQKLKTDAANQILR